jgi:DNA polymerase
MKYDQIVTCDFETYFDAEYSLTVKRYNTSEYIRDEKFKIHCVSVKVGAEPAQIFYGDSIEGAFDGIDWTRTALLAHNTAFDGFILSHHYGITPAYYLDTLSMARAVHANSIRADLDTVASFYGVGNKIPDVLGKTKGLVDLPLDLLLSLGRYCAADVGLCYDIFLRMRPQFSAAEMDLIDLTLRMFCEPVLLVDISRAEKALQTELDDRAALIRRTGLTEKELRSANKFAAALLGAGLQPPTKTSKRTGKLAFAFAKADLDFQELLQHPEENIRDLVAARMAAKSTIEETRAIRFIRAGSFGRPLPVLLNYFRAHTGRWTGGNKMNMQNLTRDGELRKSVLAPPGFKIVWCDSAQIEARTLAWLSDHATLLELFRQGVDTYKYQASLIYNVNAEDITPQQRFVGKVCVLGLGYGMGADKFQYTLAIGLMGPPVRLPLKLCKEIVGKWRISNLPIPGFWSTMDNALVCMKEERAFRHKGIEFRKDSILLPDGVVLHYPNLKSDYSEIHERHSNFRYYSLIEAAKERMGGTAKANKLYGGLLTENVTQAAARSIVAHQMLEIAKRYKVVTMSHDEVVCVVPDAEVEDAKREMVRIMSVSPSWGQDIPLNAEAESGATYG